MAVSTTVALSVYAQELVSNDLGTATMPHRWDFPGALRPSGIYDSGVTDNTFDQVWSDSRTLAATTEDIDLYGSLTKALGGATISAAELCGIFVKNKATAVASVLIMGNGTAGAFANLFNALGDRVKIPASGCFCWFAPLDGGGVTITATTADILKFDSGAASISYDLLLLFRLS